MTFNPLEEKGIILSDQLRSWEDIVKRPFDKYDVDCYSRTRQILMNGIEIEAWGLNIILQEIVKIMMTKN